MTNINVEDKENMKRVLQFLKQTINNKRVMGEDNLSKLRTCINAAYGVHPELKIHTSCDMSFGYGIVHCKCSKQKFNKKSSTEAEVVGVTDYLPYKI